jgi:hypothetical protein
MRKTPPSSSVKPLVLLVALAVASVGTGCGAACDTSDENNAPERYTGGAVAYGGYESSPWRSGLLPFPGGKQYQLDHHLGFTPSWVGIDLAFGPDGERVAPCSGNSCLIRCVDDQIIWIKNDTCADFWVRVVSAGRSFEGLGASCTGGSLDAGSGADAAEAATPESSTGDESPSLTDGSMPADANAGDTNAPE